MNELVEQEDIILCILEYLNIEDVFRIGFTSHIFYKLTFFLLKKQLNNKQIESLKEVDRLKIFKFLIFNVDYKYMETFSKNQESLIPKEDRLCTLTSNSNVWHSFRGNFKIEPENGKIIQWSVLLEDIPWHNSNSWKVVLGIQPKTFKSTLAVNESGFGFAIFEGSIIHYSDQGKSYYKKGIKKNGDIITIVLNCKQSYYQLSYLHNHIDLGVAFDDIPSNIIWYPYFALHGNCQIKYQLDKISNF